MYNITFQQIEAFLCIAKYMNLSKAARAMFISQPALSKTLQRFEEGIGLKLFVRGNQGVILTDVGEQLYSTLEPIYGSLNRTIDSARSTSTSPKKTLNIVGPISYDVSENYYEIKRTVKQFEDNHPDFFLNESLCDFKELRQAIEFGNADIVFTQDFVLNNIPNVSYKRISEFELNIAMAANHPAAAYDELNVEMLNGETIYRVAVVGDFYDRQLTLDQCKEIGFTPKKVEFVQNFQTMLHYIIEKKGMSLCGKFNFANKEDNVKYYPVKNLTSKSYVVIAWSQERLTSTANIFINMFEELELPEE